MRITDDILDSLLPFLAAQCQVGEFRSLFDLLFRDLSRARAGRRQRVRDGPGWSHRLLIRSHSRSSIDRWSGKKWRAMHMKTSHQYTSASKGSNLGAVEYSLMDGWKIRALGRRGARRHVVSSIRECPFAVFPSPRTNLPGIQCFPRRNHSIVLLPWTQKELNLSGLLRNPVRR